MKQLHLLAAMAVCLLPFLPAKARAEERTLRFAGVERHYLIRLPAAQTAARLPVVMVLHGGGGNGENAERMSGFTERLRNEAVILVYPDGTGRFPRVRALKTWNAGHCCGYAMKEDVDDVGFIGALIDELVQSDHADPKRIYVTGMSNGAMMAHRLAIALSSKIAAVAPVMGGLFGDEARPAQAVSALIINGAQDQSVPLGGGPGGGRFPDQWDGTPLKPADYEGAYWAAADGCKAQPEISRSASGAVMERRYLCPAGRAVRQYIVEDSAHAWPGGTKGSARGAEPSTSFDATGAIWDFFRGQRKP